MKLSIIIPCYNASPWLGQTLDSALAQAWPEKEIIVIDDGSTDNSRQIAKAFVSKGVKILEGTQQNAAAARNRGIQASTGDYLQFLDADDLLAPDKIRHQMTRAEKSPAGTVFTGCWARFTNTLTSSHIHQANPLFSDLSPTDYLCLYASNDCMMHPASWLVPRHVAEAAGSWDERLTLNDDGEYFARVVAAASQIAYCPNAMSYYRSSLPGSLSGQRSRKHLESAYLAMNLIVSQMLALENSPAMRQGGANLCQRFAYDYYPASPDLIEKALCQARELGGSTFSPLGGRKFQLLRKLVGWKLARRLECYSGSFPDPTQTHSSLQSINL
jgi:GT2 family glycosyltransferase